MSRIENAFKNNKAFIAYLTAGDPTLEKTVEFVLQMEQAGADLVEIGIPFSDPAAEGIVIQRANTRALKAGTNLLGVFEIAEKIREKSQIPIVFLTYLNPLHHLGYEKFFKKCKDVGVDGVIIPDMPFEERDEVAEFAAPNGVDVITLVAPTTLACKGRIEKIAKESTGFIYAVSSMGVTGMRDAIETDLEAIVKTIKATSKTPVAIGFGINTPEQAKNMAKIADGVIVGSAIVKIIEEFGENATPHLKEYVSKMKSSIGE